MWRNTLNILQKLRLWESCQPGTSSFVKVFVQDVPKERKEQRMTVEQPMIARKTVEACSSCFSFILSNRNISAYPKVGKEDLRKKIEFRNIKKMAEILGVIAVCL
jgi:hypothetical protein